MTFDELKDINIDAYIKKQNFEKEALVALYMRETGLRADQIVLINRTDNTGMRFYPAPRDPKFDDIAPEVRRLKDKISEALEILDMIARWPNHNIPNTSAIMASIAKQGIQALKAKPTP